jgi:ornithine carbamoyltransferase
MTARLVRTPGVVSEMNLVGGYARTRKPDAPARHFLSILDLSHEQLEHVLGLAAAMKRDRTAGKLSEQVLARQHVALLFEKPSLRTRSTFTIAVRELGGDVIEPGMDVALGGRESLEDVAHNLERWVVAAIVRTFGQDLLRDFAAAATRMHVINALTDEEHPCQAIADIMTLRERFGDLAGRTLAFVGDGNNVATSVAQAGVMAGMNVRIASPKGYELPASVIRACERIARHGAMVTIFNDPGEAVRGVDAIYTDAWTSMGQEAQSKKRDRVFKTYQVNAKLMSLASPTAVFMHCLPAHRGFEVTDDVMDSPASIVFDQSENRLHTQKALMTLLLQ